MAIHYDLILHSLTSVLNESNYRRQYLVLERWCRDVLESYGGILITDIPSAIHILSIVKVKLENDFNVFSPLISNIFEVLWHPVVERKAYQSLNSTDILVTYIQSIASFLNVEAISVKIEVIKCFCCIINGCVNIFDPLKDTSSRESETMFDFKPVQDMHFLHSIILKANVLESFVYELRLGVESYAHSKSLLCLQPHENETAEDDITDSVDEEDSIASSLQTGRENLKMLESLLSMMLRLCVDLSKDSSIVRVLNENQLCNILISLLRNMVSSGFQDRRINDIIEILWNCLEESVGDSDNVKDSVDVIAATETLIMLLVELLDKGYRQVDKEMRNDVLVLMTIVARLPGARETMVLSGVLSTLLTFACAEEGSQLQSNLNIRNFRSASAIDIELKHTMWLFISDLLRGGRNDFYDIASASPFVSCLLTYLDQNSLVDTHKDKSFVSMSLSVLSTDRPSLLQHSAGPSSYSEAFFASLSHIQLRELQVMGAVFLAEHVSFMLSAFTEQEGSMRILAVLDRYAYSTVPEHRSLVYNSILILVSICAESESMKTSIVESSSSVMDTLLGLLNNNDEDAIRGASARLISVLCTNNASTQKHFQRIGGIQALINHLVRFADPRKPLVGMNNKRNLRGYHDEHSSTAEMGKPFPGGEANVLMTSLIACLQSSVVGCNANERIFAQIEGIDALLDLLEVSHFIVQVRKHFSRTS